MAVWRPLVFSIWTQKIEKAAWRKKSQGQMSKPINTGWPGDQGEASRVGSGVGAGPSAQNLEYLHSPGGNTLTRTSCPEPDRQVEHLSSSSNYLHQGDGPSCPSRWVFGQRAFPPDLEPRPEALIALKKKNNTQQKLTALLKAAGVPEDTLQGSSECAKSVGGNGYSMPSRGTSHPWL